MTNEDYLSARNIRRQMAEYRAYLSVVSEPVLADESKQYPMSFGPHTFIVSKKIREEILDMMKAFYTRRILKLEKNFGEL